MIPCSSSTKKWGGGRRNWWWCTSHGWGGAWRTLVWLMCSLMMEMLLKVCGRRSPHVTLCQVQDGDFKDCESFFQQLFYERYYNPTIFKWHLFFCRFPASRTARLCVSMKESILPEHRPNNLYVVTKTNFFLDFQNVPEQPPTWQEALTLATEGDAVRSTPWWGIFPWCNPIWGSSRV